MSLMLPDMRVPTNNAEEMNRERGVVVQEIARSDDQPAIMAEHLIDQAVFGDHPLGRPVLGPTEHIRDTFTREGIVAFRKRRWSAAAGAAFVVGNLDSLGSDGELERAFERFDGGAAPESFDPAPAFVSRVMVRERDSNQSHLRLSYRPAVDVSSPRERAALAIYSTLLGGSMGSRLFDEIREQRGLAYSVSAVPHAYADVPVLQLSAGLESAKTAETYRRMRDIVSELRDDGPTEAEVDRARAYAAGARAIAFENSGAVARFAAQQTIVYGDENVDPDRTISLLDEVTYDDVRAVAAGVADELAIAVVGPHTVEELERA